MKSYTKVDLETALQSVSSTVRQAYEESHARLRQAGIPHLIVGGLAVNAHGLHYTTKDVDYLVRESDAFDGAIVLTHKPDVPIFVNHIPIDYVVINPAFPRTIQYAMAGALEAARALPEKVAVVQDWLLVWMKLNANRPKDRAAIVGLIQVGLDVDATREALVRVGDARVLGLFDRCVVKATEEDGK